MTGIIEELRNSISSGDFTSLRNLKIARPEHFNWYSDVFEAFNLEEIPDEKALVWTDGNNEQSYTFRQLADETSQLVNFLRKYGVEQQDIIFFQMPLLPPNWLVMLAGIKGGFRLVPAATILGVHDIVYRFGKLMPKVVVCDVENASKIDEAEQLSGKNVPLKIIVDGDREGWKRLDEIYKESTDAETANTKAEDPLFLFFTSGTTGMPKVVIHTYLSYPFGHFSTSSWIGLRKGDLHFNISQPGWGKFAWSSFFGPWNVGATIFSYNPNGRFNAKDYLQIIEKYQISTFCAPPTVLRMLIQEDLKAYKWNLRECVAAGEPLNPEIIEIWKEGTGKVIRDGYGQTESTCIVANLPGNQIKYGSMGMPTFLYDVVIADEDGTILPTGEEGNICIKMENNAVNGIFIDYFENPEKRAEVFKHGLYYTGDKAYMDEDGYVWFVGRDDDVIKTSDYRVGPFEVESMLLEHEAVMESAVVGSPHPIKGFEVKAYIILSEGYQPTKELAEELFAFARKNIAPYKMPRLLEFVDELPKTISGKIRRVELRAKEAVAKAEKTKLELEYTYSS